MSETSSNKKPKTKSSAADAASDEKSGDSTTVATSTPSSASDKPATGAPKKHPPAKQGKGGGVWLTLLILLLMAGGGGGGYFLWQTLQATQQRLDADNASLRQQLESLTGRTDQVEQQAGVVAQLEQQVNALPEDIAALKERQATLEDAFGKLRSEVGDARTWTVEEIAALLQIANDRLQLEGNIPASVAALQAADQHLLDMKNPALVNIRRLIAEEITTLQTTANPDITGMALSLDALAKEVDRLPVASNETTQEATPAPAAGEKGWRGVLHDFWEKLKSLVVIKRRSEAERPLLAPDERYFLQQNLRLELESARLALLRRDGKLYQNSLGDAQQWITKYFDQGAPATTGALKELARLQHIDIAPKLPDISESLNALQSWLKQHGQQQAAEATQP